jgi:hypothetical protein
MGVVPSGNITYFHDFGKDSYFIRKLTPAERVEPIANESQKIIGDPVYFSLRTPRRFNQAKLTLEYRRSKCGDALPCFSTDILIIEAGLLVDKTVWRYDLKPIENKIIDQLALAWDVIKEGSTLLIQRPQAGTTTEKKYNSIKEFLDNLPPREEIALYNYEIKEDYNIADYSTSSGQMTIAYSLRGPYQFYTYLKDEDLAVNFSLVDLNLNKDSDPVSVLLYYNNELIDTKQLADDGITNDGGRESDVRVFKFTQSNLPEGVYKVELKANDDIITKELTTRQQKLAFINKLWLFEGKGKDFALFTDSSELHAVTANPDSLQTIQTDDQELEIQETYKQYDLIIAGTSTEIKLSKDDIILSGDGVFSFNRNNLINPSFKKVNSALNLVDKGINYVVAEYKTPSKQNNWLVSSASYDLTRGYRENGQYSFIISIPGLRTDDEIDDYIELGEIKVDLTGKTLLEKLHAYFSIK